MYPFDVPGDGHCTVYTLYLLLSEQFGQTQLDKRTFLESIRKLLIDVLKDKDLSATISPIDKENWNKLVSAYIEENDFGTGVSDVILGAFCKVYNCNFSVYWIERKSTKFSVMKHSIGSGILSLNVGFFHNHIWPLFPSRELSERLQMRKTEIWKELQEHLSNPKKSPESEENNVILLEDSDVEEDRNTGDNEVSCLLKGRPILALCR